MGLMVMVAFAWLIAERRQPLPWKMIAAGLALQFVLALILLKVPASREIFLVLNGIVAALQAATTAGTSFVFGYLGGGTLPFETSAPGAAFILALQAFLRRVHHHRRAFAEQDPGNLDEGEHVALHDLGAVQLVDLPLIVEHHLEDSFLCHVSS